MQFLTPFVLQVKQDKTEHIMYAEFQNNSSGDME